MIKNKIRQMIRAEFLDNDLEEIRIKHNLTESKFIELLKGYLMFKSVRI